MKGQETLQSSSHLQGKKNIQQSSQYQKPITARLYRDVSPVWYGEWEQAGRLRWLFEEKQRGPENSD